MPRTGRPKSENPKIEQIRIRLEPQLKKDFTEKCESHGENYSDLIRKWILEFLEDKKK